MGNLLSFIKPKTPQPVYTPISSPPVAPPPVQVTAPPPVPQEQISQTQVTCDTCLNENKIYLQKIITLNTQVDGLNNNIRGLQEQISSLNNDKNNINNELGKCYSTNKKTILMTCLIMAIFIIILCIIIAINHVEIPGLNQLKRKK